MKLKRIIALVLCLCMMISVQPLQAAAAEEEIIASGKTPMQWKLTADGTLTVSGSGAMDESDLYDWAYYSEEVKKVIIGEDVTSIAKKAFNRMPNLTQVQLGESVKIIGEQAFEFCEALQAVHFPASVTSIENEAFRLCSSLAEVTFDPQVQDLYIGNTAFSSICAKELVIPGGVKQIGEYAFARNEQLTTLVLNEGIQQIETSAFSECPSLTGHLYLPASLTKIGDRNFDNTAAWTSVEIRTNAAGYSFRDATTLQEVTLSGEMTSVPNAAFQNSSVTTLTIGANITEIQDYAFFGCANLTQVDLPESLQTMGYEAFAASGLTSVVIPDSVTTMEERVFENCKSLVSAKVGSGLETLASLTFGECVALHEIDLGNVKYIDSFAMGSTGLSSVQIPETVTVLGQGVFRSSLDLKDIYFLGDAPEFHFNAFEGAAATAYYDPSCDGWTNEVRQDYGGEIVWAIEGHEHSYTSVITPVTCTEDGYTTHTCTECGDIYIDAQVEAPGHDFTEWEITNPPTCALAGTNSRSCNTCGEVFTEEIPANGHDYVDGVCSVCGNSQPILNAPQILSCYSKLQTSVKVTWTLEENADGYELWRSETPDDEDSWNRVKTITDGETDRYTNQGLTEGVTYYYKVRAYVQDEDGNKTYSAFSNVDYMPAAVVWDGPYSNAVNRIRLRWNEIDGAHGYQIWLANTADDAWTIVKTLGDKGNELTDDQGATTAYSNTALDAGKKYTYKMRAFMIKEDGRKVFGAYSNEITVAVMPVEPVITVASPKEGRVQVRWDAVNGADGYQVWMYADGNWSIIKSVTDGSIAYTKTGLTTGTEYKFRVRAYTEVDGKKTFGGYSEIGSSIAAGPIVIASGKCGDNLTWALDDIGTLIISGTGEMYDLDFSNHPWAEREVYKVIVESGVTSIGAHAFEVTNDDLAELKEISLPNTLKEIGYYAFGGSAITQLKIPDSVTSVDEYAFTGSALTSVTWPKGAKTVSVSAFEYCVNLTEVVIPEGITTIDYAAFRNCRNLASVSIPSTLTTIEDYAFSHCDTLESAALPDSVTTMSNSVFEGCDNLQIVYLPQNLTTIAFGTFRDCYNLQAVLLPEKLTTIEANAFSGCDALVELYFPGTEEQLAKIEVYEGNEPLQYVTVYLVTLEEE